MRTAFHIGPHCVDQVADFACLEVSGLLDRPQESRMVNHWHCADDCRMWHRGHGYRESHGGIPKRLRRVGRDTCIREFVVCE